MPTSDKEQSTPRQVIDRIRTHNFLLDLDTASEMVKEGALSLQTQLNSALKLLSDDLYSKKSHFVLELVQNADDNHYAPGVSPHLTLQVTPSRLVVINNEVGFTSANVKAICSVGASSKSKDKSGYIGEKGIGFKSVFTVSDAPEIHSNNFHFKFDRTVEGNLLGYVVPHWCESPADVRSESTTIILPAAKGYEFGADTLVDIDARLLLFLNKLRELTLDHNGKRVTYRRGDNGEKSTLSTTRGAEGDDPLSDITHYVRAELTFPMKDRYVDEKRPEIEQSTVVLAFPTDDSGAARPESTSHVFAFLPIRQMGFKFSIQADFILNSSREEVLTDRPWNQLLRAGVAVVFSNAIESFKKSEPLALSYLKYIPGEGEVIDPFFRSVRKDILEFLAKKSCLLAASGDWRKPSELRLADKSFRALFPSANALSLFGFDYVDDRMQGGAELLRSLGTKDAGMAEVLSVFTSHGSWLKAQPIEWRAKFYAVVANNQKTLIAGGLFKTPCLPISNGTYAVPAQVNAFFPLGKGRKYGFEAELVFVDNELYEDAQRHSEQISSLFSAMKVRADEPYDLISGHILSKHKGESWKQSDAKALIGHLRYIKDKIKEYLDIAAVHGKSESEVFRGLREGIWIGTKHEVDGVWHFNRIENLYLSRQYKPYLCLETLLGGALVATQFVSADYMAVKPKDSEAEAESWRNFLIRLGIRTCPAVEAEGHNWKCSKEMQLLLDSTNVPVRRATLETIDKQWSAYAGRMSYSIPAGRTSQGPFETKLAISLRATQAPTKKRTTVSLAESYYPTVELRTLFGESLPYVEVVLSDAMLDACRVTHRLDAKALVKRLKQLKADGSGTTKQVQGIYRALDERLWDTDSAYIKQAFGQEGLIQVKGLHKGWFKPGEVAWRSNGPFLDAIYPPLQSLYRDDRFFVDKLGIPRELSTEKWVAALSRLADLASPDERKAEALNIYRRANRDLGPRFGHEVAVPGWIETFQSEAVYVNQRGELVPNNEYLFANDAPDIAALFEGDDDLSFLAVPSLEVPRLSRLLDAAEVAKLSESISQEVTTVDPGVIDAELTERVQRSMHYFARVLYARRPEEFERALKDGQLAKLRTLDVAKVPQVDLLVSIGECSRRTTADMALTDGHVVYRAGARSLKDMLARELVKHLGASSELSDTFARILMENDVESIEDFLKVTNIGEMPADLWALLHASVDPVADEEGTSLALDEPIGEREEGTSEEDSAFAGTTENGGSPPGGASSGRVSQQVPASQVTPGKGGGQVEPNTGGAGFLSSTPFLAPKASPTLRPIPAQPHSPGLGATGLSSTHKREDGQKPASGPLAVKDFPAAESDNLATRGVNPTGHPGGESTTDSSGAFNKSPHDSPLAGQSGAFKSGSFSTGSDGAGNRPKRGQPQPPRTKSGRLLSYVVGPGDASNPHPDDDPAKAAAREATGRAAVEYFLTTQVGRWKSMKEMPHNNPGFDIQAVTSDDQQEFIEVKGQGSAWTEEGVALTPTELMTAQQKGERYWLCVVEYAQDEKRRQLHLVRNPFGLTQQFRFDVGWKSAAESVATVLQKPEKDIYINMPGVGRGRILSVRGKGRFFNLHVILEDGRQVNKLFNPTKMTLSKESMWQG